MLFYKLVLLLCVLESTVASYMRLGLGALYPPPKDNEERAHGINDSFEDYSMHSDYDIFVPTQADAEPSAQIVTTPALPFIDPTAVPVLPTSPPEKKKFSLGVFFKTNWFRALQYCRYKGMELATVDSEEEEAELEKLIESVGIDLGPIWTSGADHGEEGQFFWMSSGLPLTYRKWFGVEPNGGRAENCMVVVAGDDGYGWRDFPCDRDHSFACQYYPSQKASKPTPNPNYV